MIFEATGDLVENGLGIDPLTVRTRLEERGQLERVGGPAYLHCMDLDLPDLGRTGAHVEIVKDRSLRRRLASLGVQLGRVAFDGDQSGQEVLGALEVALLNIGSHGNGTDLDVLGPIAQHSVAALEEEPAGALPKLRTGLAELDSRAHGLPRGSLIVIAGRPGMGKTALGLTIAQDLTLRQGKAAAFFSLEMGEAEIALCQLSRQSERRGVGTRPQLSDLRGSGKIEEDADLVLFPWPAEVGSSGPGDADTQLIIAKQRNGPTGEVPLRFERELVTFLGLETLETTMGIDA